MPNSLQSSAESSSSTGIGAIVPAACPFDHSRAIRHGGWRMACTCKRRASRRSERPPLASCLGAPCHASGTPPRAVESTTFTADAAVSQFPMPFSPLSSTLKLRRPLHNAPMLAVAGLQPAPIWDAFSLPVSSLFVLPLDSLDATFGRLDRPFQNSEAARRHPSQRRSRRRLWGPQKRLGRPRAGPRESWKRPRRPTSPLARRPFSRLLCRALWPGALGGRCLGSATALPGRWRALWARARPRAGPRAAGRNFGCRDLATRLAAWSARD